MSIQLTLSQHKADRKGLLNYMYHMVRRSLIMSFFHFPFFPFFPFFPWTPSATSFPGCLQ